MSGLNLQQLQSLVLTQDLRQAISMLSMSSEQLDELVQAELLANPALKLENDDDNLWISTTGTSQFDVALAQCATPQNFRDHLSRQLSTQQFNAMAKEIAHAIIHSLDEHGLLMDAPAAFSFIEEDLGVFPEWIELVRLRLMDLDPLGCGAKDMNEALTHQVSRIFLKKPQGFLSLLKKMAAGKVTTPSTSTLMSALRGVDIDQLKQLNPKPATSFRDGISVEPRIYTDVVVTQSPQGFSVSLTREPSKRIAWINVNTPKKSVPKIMKDGVRRAHNLHKALLYREQSLLKICHAIVVRQSRWFFSNGDLTPLVLAEVASDAGVHESTVSRISSVNNLTCSRGTFGLKYFFGGHLGGVDKSNIYSTNSVKLKIQKLVQGENKNNPLSDQEIAACLLQQGIDISRRTVTKYRHQLNMRSAPNRRVAYIW